MPGRSSPGPPAQPRQRPRRSRPRAYAWGAPPPRWRRSRYRFSAEHPSRLAERSSLRLSVVDQDVAKTLGELERKLLELERTLAAIGHEERQVEETAPSTAPAQPSWSR